ncbi:hypothetical protein [Leptolyngbya sp. 'hensonii']|uniref:hypothetical protein n=1 Tax=Leptolyngbya sp. 'hensonii' TaxID=1922337 RepID=UPI000A99323D|nr:hypothetical protein [Leptolyngbya sp. 'hensonii']
MSLLQHPLENGQVFYSPGAQFCYRVIGPCCRLYDREQLPWPCCRIQWGSKEPSWRRVGRRLIADMATRNHPSYVVEILGQEKMRGPIVVTLYSIQLSKAVQEWWHAKTRSAIACNASGTAEESSTEG